MATTKKKARKRRPRPPGEPITVGGGSGQGFKSRKYLGDSFLDFDRNHYKKKSGNKYESSDVLLGMDISCGTIPSTGPSSVIELGFADSRTSGSNISRWITITGDPLGIEFTGDWVTKGPTKFYCSYLEVREVWVDGRRVAKVSNGNCKVIAYNLSTKHRLSR